MTLLLLLSILYTCAATHYLCDWIAKLHRGRLKLGTFYRSVKATGQQVANMHAPQFNDGTCLVFVYMIQAYKAFLYI